MKGIGWMKRAIDGLQKIQIAAGGLFLAVFLITVVYQMFTRFIGVSATWTEDVVQYSFIWAVFMGASAMVHAKAHFAFSSLRDLLKSEVIKGILSILITILMLVFCIYMFGYGVMIAKKFWNYTWVNIPQFKRGPTWLCLPISGATSAIYLLYQLFDEIKRLVKGGKK